MQSTSSLYKSIVAKESHWFETKVTIAGVTVLESGIKSLNRKRTGSNTDNAAIGGAFSSQLNLAVIGSNLVAPRMAEIDVYFRATDGVQVSEWLPGGIYYIDTRKKTEGERVIGVTEFVAYDAMMKFEQDYPNTNHTWPYRDTYVLAEMASAVGVTVDPRTYEFLTAGYMIKLPANYTMREVLGRIAAMYVGNFVISSEGKLLFVPLWGLSDDLITANYLADEDGNALVFGNEGWYIIV